MAIYQIYHADASPVVEVEAVRIAIHPTEKGTMAVFAYDEDNNLIAGSTNVYSVNMKGVLVEPSEPRRVVAYSYRGYTVFCDNAGDRSDNTEIRDQVETLIKAAAEEQGDSITEVNWYSDDMKEVEVHSFSDVHMICIPSR